MAYAYVATSSRPTAVQQAIVCSFTAPSSRNLVLAKGNRIEVHDIVRDGISPVTEFEIYGKICTLSYYRPANMNQDVIFVLTAKKQFCILVFDSVTCKINNRACGNLRDRIGTDSRLGPRGFIDPENRMIAMVLYEQYLKIIPLDDKGGMREAFNVRVDVLKLIDICFLHGHERPMLCLLCEDSKKVRQIKLFSVDIKNRILVPGPWENSAIDPTAYMIHPIQKPFRGVVVFAETTISYYDGSKTSQIVAVKPSKMISVGALDAGGFRMLVGDHRGSLSVLILGSDGSAITDICFESLGTTSIATSLCYLDNGVVFVGSSIGDSQIIRLPRVPYSASSPAVEVLSTYSNMGPILDMCVVESEGYSQSQVVTCSGALRSGSLRIVRSGIGIQEQASIEVLGIKRMWSVRISDDSPYDTYLIQSFTQETRILAIDEEELSEGFIPGFINDQPTLFCGNIMGNHIVQVTATSLVLIHLQSNAVAFRYLSPNRITVAVGNAVQVVLATSGSELLYFEVGADGIFALVSQITLDNDIACMSMRPVPVILTVPVWDISGAPPIPSAFPVDSKDKEFRHIVATDPNLLHPSAKSFVLAVGMWTDGSIRLFELPSLIEMHRTQIGADTQIRDILMMHHIDETRNRDTSEITIRVSSFILCGMGDGCVISYSMDSPNQQNIVTIDDLRNQAPSRYTLASRRRVVLGTRPVTLTCFIGNERLCAFAASDRPTVVYIQNSQLLFSMVNTSEISAAASFHCKLFPNCLALSSENSFTVCNLDTVQKVHVETCDIGEVPHKICFSPLYSVYGVLSSKIDNLKSNTGVPGVEFSTHIVSFWNMDFKEKIYAFELDPLEQGLSILCTTLQDLDGTASLSHGGSNTKKEKEYVIVGTGYAVPGEIEPSRGRILVFQIDRVVHSAASDSSRNSIAVNYDDFDDSKVGDQSGDFSTSFHVTMILERPTKGGVFSLTSNQGRLVAAIHNKLQVFKFIDSAGGIAHPDLKSECGHHGHMMTLFLKSCGNTIALGDLLQSVTMLRYDSNAPALQEVARDFTSNYMRAIEIIDENTFLGAEDHQNIFMLVRDVKPAGSTEPETGRLEHCGEFHIGEHINVFRQGTLTNRPIEQSDIISTLRSDAVRVGVENAGSKISNNSKSSGKVKFTGSAGQSILYGTCSGAIGSILTIDEATYKLFSALEKCIQSVVHSIGGLNHSDWRSFLNERKFGGQQNFVDGDLVECFLKLSYPDMAKVVSILNDELDAIPASRMNQGDTLMTVEVLLARVEEISRFH